MPWNAGQLVFDVQRKLQFHPRFTQPMVLAGLNRGVEKLVLFASEDDDVMETLNPLDPDGSGNYAREFPLPQEVLYVNSVQFDDFPLKQVTQPEFINTFTRPRYFRRNPIWYYIRHNQYLNIFPLPTAQKKVKIYGVFKPADMVLLTDPVPLARQYTDALISYAAFWCTDGLKGQEEVQRNNIFLQEYMAQRAEAKFNFTQNTEHKIGRAR